MTSYQYYQIHVMDILSELHIRGYMAPHRLEILSHTTVNLVEYGRWHARTISGVEPIRCRVKLSVAFFSVFNFTQMLQRSPELDCEEALHRAHDLGLFQGYCQRMCNNRLPYTQRSIGDALANAGESPDGQLFASTLQQPPVCASLHSPPQPSSLERMILARDPRLRHGI